MVNEVATKLAQELATLNYYVRKNPLFRPPSEVAEIAGRLPGIVELTLPGTPVVPAVPGRTGRAVSLPPNTAGIHEEREEKGSPPSVRGEFGERRTLGDGLPQYQPYW